MAKRVGYALHRCLLDICLVNRVAQDKHVVSTDTNKHKRHQLVDTSGLASEQVQQAETGSVRKQNRKDAYESYNTTAVHRTERSKEEERVDDDKQDGSDDQSEVMVYIEYHSLDQTLNSEQMELVVADFAIPEPVTECLLQFLLPAQVRFIVDVRIATRLDLPDTHDGFGRHNIITA